MLSKDEVKEMLESTIIHLTKHNNSHTIVILDEKVKERVQTVVDDCFKKVDKSKNGTIDIDEFVEGFSENPETLAFFNQF